MGNRSRTISVICPHCGWQSKRRRKKLSKYPYGKCLQCKSALVQKQGVKRYVVIEK